jgi:radical SAM superfamily enzyme YgiQ (UPF0313 family)
LKIAMIAMSGVRAHDPVLTQIGMSLPGFADRANAIASLPSLSLLTIAALTPDRHDVTYHEIEDVQAAKQLPTCDVAAISTFTARVKDAYAVSEQYRRQGTMTVIGGLHATALPHEAKQHCDSVVVGEGEIGWPRLVRDLEKGRLQDFYRADGQEFDLAHAPMPRFDLLGPRVRNRFTVQAQRGCPWRCDFCASSIQLTSRYKLKPPAMVAAEIESIVDLYADPFIEFADDNTFVDKRRSRELMEAVGETGVKWFTETDVSIADDPGLLEMMREAGCQEILIGFETPTASGLDGVELRRNWKSLQHDKYLSAIDRIQSAGIAVNACFVLGLDGDGSGVFESVHRFVAETQPFDVQITVLTPFPGSASYERLRREGRIIEEEAWERCTLFDVNIRPQLMTARELEEGFVQLGLELYGDGAVRRRRAAFRTRRNTQTDEAAAAGVEP